MRIAVVGATGNVGTAVLRRLRQAQAEGFEPWEVVGIARRLPAEDQAPYDGVEWHAVDVAGPDARQSLAEAFTNADAVIHLAWVLQPNHREDVMHRINVDGTANALAAAADAGVRHFVCASSVGAYSPAPDKPTVDETWPARGISSSHYSRFKGEQEALLDAFAGDHLEMTISRLRPGLIFQRDAGMEIGRYFMGPVIPKFLLNKLRLPVLPIPASFVFQVVHADDIADAYFKVVQQRAGGAFNIAADPVITPRILGGILGARRVLNLPTPWLRILVGVAWSLRLIAADPGWVDMAGNAPVMDTDRARRQLGWQPRHSSVEALHTILEAVATNSGRTSSPPLSPDKHRPSA